MKESFYLSNVQEAKKLERKRKYLDENSARDAKSAKKAKKAAKA